MTDNVDDRTSQVDGLLVKDAIETGLRQAAGCSECIVDGYATATLPLTQRRITRGKLRSASGRFYDIALDENSNVVDPDSLLETERAAVFARQGHLRDELFLLSQSSAVGTVPVWIWADFHDTSPRREDLIADAKLESAKAGERAAALHAAVSPIVAWLDAHGYNIVDRGDRSPQIIADVPISALSTLGKLPGISVVGLQEKAHPNSTHWFNTVQAGTAQASLPTTTLPFCVKEGSQPDTYTNLSVPSANIASPTGYSDFHTAWTAELIASTGTYRMAPSAPTYIANWAGYTGDIDGWCWARARAMNFSWSFSNGAPGGLNGNDYAFDFAVKQTPYPLIAVAAGNSGDVSGFDTVQNRGYNVLVVGASDDHGTDSVADDTMASFSSWRNPATTWGDSEAPALVAPGVHVSSTSYTASGTSGSTPIALGAGLLAFAQDSRYESWPEMARASYVAAAVAPVDGLVTHLGGLGGSDLKQGAGLLNVDKLRVVADAANWKLPGSAESIFGHYAKTYSFNTDFDSVSGLSYDTYKIGSFVGYRMRVGIAWDATATGCDGNPQNCTGETLDADLDLFVYDSNGSVVCSSTSSDSSWEFCDFPCSPRRIQIGEVTP